jgi:hypothetical protein
MIKVIGPKDKKDQTAVNTTSSSPNWTKQLSPFFLGPIKLYSNFVSMNLENGWQYSKVYPSCVDEQGNPSEKYWDWAKKGWAKGYADRYPMGKGKIPLYSYWNGNKLSYVEARTKIYLPLYQEAVGKTEAFKKLKDLYDKEQKIVLFDFDGYDYLALGHTLKDVLNNPNKKMGHAFVLAMMLQFGKDFKIENL